MRVMHLRGSDGKPACGLSLTRWGSMDVSCGGPKSATCQRNGCKVSKENSNG